MNTLRELGPSAAQTIADTCARTRQWASDLLNRLLKQNREFRTEGRPILYYLPGQDEDLPAGTTPEQQPTTRLQLVEATEPQAGTLAA
jgi:hypothetical protein